MKEVLLLILLCGCSHAGLLKEDNQTFDSDSAVDDDPLKACHELHASKFSHLFRGRRVAHAILSGFAPSVGQEPTSEDQDDVTINLLQIECSFERTSVPPSP